MMQVMTLHKWYDVDVESVSYNNANDLVREIAFKSLDDFALLLHRDDVIALAKEFELVVYNKDAAL